jgi:hypothetical protein
VVVVGTARYSDSTPICELALARLHEGGALDVTLGTAGVDTARFDPVGSIAVGATLWSGRATAIGQAESGSSLGLARLTSRLVACDGFEGAPTAPWLVSP